jgi:hypothetical protein
MKNTLKYFIAICFFCSTLAVFAQPGEGNGSSGDAGLDGGAESDTTGGAPIDDYVWVLAGLGLVYVWRLRAFAPQGKSTQE